MTNRMTAMSVFNSKMPEQSIPVFNSWDAQASQKGIERAAEKITGVIDKATGKLATDIQKSTEKLVAATKDGAEKVSDTVKRTATTNAAGNGQTASAPTAVATLHESLQSIATATAEVADYARTHPTDIPTALKSAKTIAQQYTDLTDRASSYAEEGQRFRETAAATAQAVNWIAGRYDGGGGIANGGLTQTFHVGNEAFNAIWNQYGG